MAVKLAVARKAESPYHNLAARLLMSSDSEHGKACCDDAEAMKRLSNHFDLLILTVPEAYPMHIHGLLNSSHPSQCGCLGQLQA